MTGPARSLPRLVLASASPRRRELLASLGIQPRVRPVTVDESAGPGEAPQSLTRRLAIEKAERDARPGELVLAGDTIVAVEGRLLGKPEDRDAARQMLELLSGREHEVWSGVALADVDRGRTVSDLDRSLVRFAPLTSREIDWYLASGEPLDKAGGYAIQGRAALFVETLVGSYSNVVGLSLSTVGRLFAELGYELLDFATRTRGLGPEA